MRRLVLGIAAAVLVALACAAPASAVDATINAKDGPFRWEPSDVTIETGDQVTWQNPDMGFHTLVFDGMTYGTVSTAWTHTEPFDQAGSYSFYCGIHGIAMSGTVTVNPVVYTWAGADGGDWTTTTNWSSSPSVPGTYPGGHSPTDIAVINNGTQPQLDVDTTIAELQVNGAGSGRQGSGPLTVTKGAIARGEFAGTGKTTFKAPDVTVDGITVEGSATVRFEGNVHLPATITLADTAKLENAGTLHGEPGGGVAGNAGTVVNSGTLDPGGTLTFAAAYEQTGSGTLDIDVGSSGAEKLMTNGATLDGTLAVHTTGGFQPAAGATFPVLTATSVTGQFAAFSADQPGGVTYKASYAATGVTLSVDAAPVQAQDPAPNNPPPNGTPQGSSPTPPPTPETSTASTKVAMTKLALLPRRCGRGHSLRFRLKKPAGAVSARVLVNGKRKAGRSGRTFTSPITLKKLPKRFTLTVRTTLGSGDKLVATKKFTRC